VQRNPSITARVAMGFALLNPSYESRIRFCILATRCARGFAFRLPSLKIRGRREDRVRAAPAVSRAICIEKCAHEHTGSAETLRPSLRNGFTAYFVLTPATGLLPPSFADCSAHLTPAPGRQVHTTSPYALASLVREHAPTPLRPPLPVPRLRRRPTPLWWDRMAGVKLLICPTLQRKYFYPKGWTDFW
jgi:hypothetical protein